MNPETIIFEKEDNVCIITLNRPERLNAMNGKMFEEIKDALDRINADDEIRAVIITGAGKAFSSGGDFAFDSSQAGKKIDLSQKELVLKLINVNKPFIAAVNGMALGAGMNLALNCDLIYASDKAEFSTFFIRRAITPEMASTYLLPRIVGMQRQRNSYFSETKLVLKKPKILA